MSTDIGKFRKQLSAMLDYIRSCVPADKELVKQQMKLETALQIDPRSTVELFIEYVKPHADEILTGNESYFLMADEKLLGIDSEYLQFSQKLKTLWVQLNADQQEKIKRYTKLLLMLGTIATKNESLRQTINKYRDQSNPLIF